jgi:thiol-disulfide isomerase/thioredoxin
MKGRRLVELGVGVVLIATLLVIAARWGGTRRAPSEPGFVVTRLEPPGAAPTFHLADLQGRQVQLEDYRGRVVVLNFWATWCGPCRDEIPAMQLLSKELGARGLTVLALNYQEVPAAVTTFVERYGLTFPVLLDRQGAVGERYRVTALPATYFVDRKGALVGAALGYREWGAPAARSYLADLLAGGA